MQPTAMQTTLTSILASRIRTEGAKTQPNFVQINETLDIFGAAGKITIDQYTTLTELVETFTVTPA